MMLTGSLSTKIYGDDSIHTRKKFTFNRIDALDEDLSVGIALSLALVEERPCRVEVAGPVLKMQ